MKVLYKYFIFNENSLSCLIHNEVWASKASEFNDPFDSSLTIDFENENIQLLFEEYVQHKGICCFSRNVDSILMWSHYADNHKGFCIGIDNPRLENSDIITTVNYSDNFLNVEHDHFLHSNIKNTINKNWEKILTQKFIDWKYEDEVRLILQLNDSNIKGKSFPLPKDSIKEIYFGCKMPEKNKETIKKVIQGNDIVFYNMKQSKNNFSLDKI